MALQFNLVSPYLLVDIVHKCCEETEVYKGKTNKESVLAGLKKHECYAIESGNVVGAVLFKGNEGHICVLSEFKNKWATKEFYKFMQDQVKLRGIIQVTSGNPDSLKFIEMLEKRGYVCLVGKKY